MDEEDIENVGERIKRLGYKPQREIVYCKLLPYSDQLDEESVRMLSEIKGNLGRAVMMREMRPGCGMWTARLSKYDIIFKNSVTIFFMFLVAACNEIIHFPNL
jgi:proteasome activator subunit 4